MTITNGYLTLLELKASISGGITGSASDTDLERAIEAASRAIDTWCERPHGFWQDPSVVDRYYTCWQDPTITSDLYLNAFTDGGSMTVDDISTATGLIVATDMDGDGSYETTWTRDTDFRLTPINAAADGVPWTMLERIRGGRYTWPTGRHGVKVTAKFGWATTPTVVKQATAILAQRYFQRRTTPFGVAGSNDMGVIRITKTDSDVVALIAICKRVRVPGRQRAMVV